MNPVQAQKIAAFLAEKNKQNGLIKPQVSPFKPGLVASTMSPVQPQAPKMPGLPKPPMQNMGQPRFPMIKQKLGKF